MKRWEACGVAAAVLLACAVSLGSAEEAPAEGQIAEADDSAYAMEKRGGGRAFMGFAGGDGYGKRLADPYYAFYDKRGGGRLFLPVVKRGGGRMFLPAMDKKGGGRMFLPSMMDKRGGGRAFVDDKRGGGRAFSDSFGLEKRGGGRAFVGDWASFPRMARGGGRAFAGDWDALRF